MISLYSYLFSDSLQSFLFFCSGLQYSPLIEEEINQNGFGKDPSLRIQSRICGKCYFFNFNFFKFVKFCYYFVIIQPISKVSVLILKWSLMRIVSDLISHDNKQCLKYIHMRTIVYAYWASWAYAKTIGVPIINDL